MNSPVSFRLRAARADDLEPLYEMAKLTGGGFTNLPADRAALTKKLERADDAFSRDADELGDGSGLEIRSEVDGVVKQQSSTSELCFNVVDIVQDLSAITTLMPGDVIATGTPGGVGAARTPPEWLTDGAVLRCSIEGIGATENRCVLP